MFTLNRAPVTLTTGVWPMGAQVVPRMVIRADPGLIGEADARALDGSLRGNGRVLLILPPSYRLAVLLVSPVDRALR